MQGDQKGNKRRRTGTKNEGGDDAIHWDTIDENWEKRNNNGLREQHMCISRASECMQECKTSSQDVHVITQ
jgi:hypothetical protein